MNVYSLASIIITVAVLIAYINHRFIKMQPTIAVTFGALIISLALVISNHIFHDSALSVVKTWVAHSHYRSLLLNGLLSFLLFAGALTVDFQALKKYRWPIGILASVSTIASTFLIAGIFYYVLPWLHLPLPFIACLLFGALISPTDPIAVLNTFKQINAPKALRTIVAGESLFNDGVGIVLFTVFYELNFTPNIDGSGFSHALIIFTHQALGGIAFGLMLGIVAKYLIRRQDSRQIALLITLAIVTGGYNLAQYLHISGPLAMVMAGLWIGDGLNQHPNKDMQNTLAIFWELIDDILNLVLFLLLGFELLLIDFNQSLIIMMLLAIILVLLVRWITVMMPIAVFKRSNKVPKPYTIAILTWGGLRGALAIALALSLPKNTPDNIILSLTYGVVVFAIIVQGTTINRLASNAKKKYKEAPKNHNP